jgi:hypothetical protein
VFKGLGGELKSFASGGSSLGGLASKLGSVGKALPGVGIVVALGVAFKKTFDECGKLADEFIGLERAEKNIDFAAKINKSLGSTSTAIKTFARDTSKELQGAFSSEDILAAIAPIAYDKSADQIKKISAAAIDLSAVTGGDLKQSVAQLNGMLSGEAGELSKLFPELKKLTAEQQRAGYGLDIVAQKVKGAAQAMGECATSSQRYANANKALASELGAVVSGFFSPMRNYLAQLKQGWADALAKRREYAEAKLAVQNGTADPDQALSVAIGPGSKTERLAYFQDEMEYQSGKKWDRTNSKEQFEYLKLIQYLYSAKDNPSKVYTDRGGSAGKVAPSSFGMTKEQFNTAARAFYSQLKEQEGFDAETGAGFVNGLKEEIQGFAGIRTTYEKAISAIKDSATGPDTTIESAAEKLNLLLQATILRIQNKIESGEITKTAGEKQISDLTSKEYLAAIQTIADKSSKKEDVDAAQQYRGAYEKSWTLKAASEEKERLDKEKEEQNKKLKEEQEYTAAIYEIINSGLSPARKALAEFDQKNLEMLEKLKEKDSDGTATQEEKKALRALQNSRKGLVSDVEEESGKGKPQKGFIDQLLAALKSGTSVSSVLPQGIGGGIGEIFGSLAGSLGPLATSFGMLTQIMNPLQTIFTAMFEVLAPVIEGILAPVLGCLKIIGSFLGNLLKPVLQMLEPIITALSEVFVWLYNSVLVPVGNGIMTVFEAVGNFLRSVINAIIGVINTVFGWAGVNIDEMGEVHLTKFDSINTADLASAGASSTSSGSSSSASYTAASDVYINITYDRSFVNGDAREIALALRKEMKAAEALGL